MDMPAAKCKKHFLINVFTKKAAVFIFLFSCYSNLFAHQLTLETQDEDNPPETKLELHSSSERTLWRNKASWISSWDNKTLFKSEYVEKNNDLQSSVSHTSALDISVNFPVWTDSVYLHSNIKSGKFKSYESAFRIRNSNSSFNHSLTSPSQFQNTQVDLSDGLVNLLLKGEAAHFDYGVEYNRVGNKYKSIGKENGLVRKDREGFDYWIGKKWDELNFKIGYSDTWNNVDMDRDTMRYTERVFKIASTYELSRWPFASITLDYKSGERFSSYVPTTKQAYTGKVYGYGASFYFTYDQIDFNLGSSLEYRNNASNSADRSQTISHYFSGRYTLTNSINIYSNVNYSIYNSSDGLAPYRYNNLDSSISINYNPDESPISTTYYLSYNRSKSNDGYTDATSISNNISLEWITSSHNNKKETALRLDLEQTNYLDGIYSSSNSSDLFVGFRWVYSFH